MTYELHIAKKSTGWAYVPTGNKSGSIRDLKHFANVANVHYRIVDALGVVVWSSR